VLRPADRGGRVVRDHLADDKPVEQYAHGRELLLDSWRDVRGLQALPIDAQASTKRNRRGRE